jgi:dTDP-4-amino-4,6-dideoxygalactose transaminase
MDQINLFSPSLNDEDRRVVQEVMRGTWITRGPEVQAFEQELAEYLGVKESVCFDNASNALNLVYGALKEESSAVLRTAPVTFAATATAGLLQAYEVKLFDNDPLSAEGSSLAGVLNKGDLYVPMHYGGQPVSLSAINKEVIVVEDACHALGSFDDEGFRVGACKHSRAAVFSFHPAKNITTFEGGAVSTNDSSLAESLRELRSNGIRRNTNGLGYDVMQASLNAHMNEVSAALGRQQLKRLDEFKQQRLALMQTYAELLRGVEGIGFVELDEKNCYHLATLLIDFEFFKIKREDLIQALGKAGVQSNVHYIPLYRFSAFPGFDKSDFPQSEKFYSQTLSLPLHCLMSESDVKTVVTVLLAGLKI